MENLQEEEEEEEEQRQQPAQHLSIGALPTLGRLNKTDAHTTMGADDRSHALLPPTTPGAPPQLIQNLDSSTRPSSTFQPFVDEQPLPCRSFGGGGVGLPGEDLPLPMDDLPMDLPDPMDDLDDLMMREGARDVDDEEEEEEHREVPRNDLSCLFDSPALLPEDSDRITGEDDNATADGTGLIGAGGSDPMLAADNTQTRDYDAATFNLNQTVAIEDKVPDHECTIMIDPEDPWKPKLIRNFLSKAVVPLTTRPGYVRMSEEDQVTTTLKVCGRVSLSRCTLSRPSYHVDILTFSILLDI